MNCRFCNKSLSHLFVSLGKAPLSNAYLSAEQLRHGEKYYPLDVYVCDSCLLVQLDAFETPEHIFGDYAYFSSCSDTWVEHARRYSDIVTSTLGLSKSSLVIEIASNDGYLLKHFLDKGIPALGIEPAANVADTARSKGVPTETVFFGRETALRLRAEKKVPDLLIGNNVLAHVPDINDFVSGLKILLKERGVITMEFPHIVRLIEGRQFDTIYHEHFSYFSFITVERIFSAHGLRVFDVEELPTHGGSLRTYICHSDDDKAISHRVGELERFELEAGYAATDTYLAFNEAVEDAKRDILTFLTGAKNDGKTVVGYGAPAKGNTLLNYCGIKTDYIDYTVDRNTYKQGRYLPGSHIPIESPDKIRETRPDYLFILPWNLKDEIMDQTSYIREWGGKFVLPIPEIRVL